MVRRYRHHLPRRALNALVGAMVRLGRSGHTVLLAVPREGGGKPRPTPVTLIEEGGRRYVVAIYGERAWVRRARDSGGEVTITKGGHHEQLRLVEVPPQEAAPILKRYLQEIPFVRPYVATQPDAPAEAFLAETARRPVFRLDPRGTTDGGHLTPELPPEQEGMADVTPEAGST